MDEALSHKTFGAPEPPITYAERTEPLPSLKGRSLIGTIGPKNNLQIRDRETGEILRDFPESVAAVRYSPVASPDGKYVAVAYNNQQVRIHEIETGKVLHTLYVKSTSAVEKCVFSPDSSCLFTLTESCAGALQTWDVQTGECLQTVYSNNYHCFALALSPDGSRIFSSGLENNALIWDTSTWKLTGKWKIPVKLNMAAYCSDGKTLVGLDSPNNEGEGTIRFWNTETGEQIRELRPEGRIGHEIALSADGKTIFLTKAGTNFQAIDAQTGATIAEAPDNSNKCWLIGTSPDGSEILSRIASDGVAQIRDAKTLEVIHEFKDVKDGLAVFIPPRTDAKTTGPTLAEINRKAWRVREQAMKTDYPIPLSAEEFAVARKSVADQLAQQAAAPEGEKPEIAWPEPFGAFVPQTELPPLTGRSLLASVGRQDGLVKVWDGRTGEKLRVFQVPGDNSILTWSPDAKHVAVASHGGFINVWDVETGEKTVEITQNGTTAPSCLCFDKAGKRLFASTKDSGVIFVWNAEDGTLLAEMKHDASLVGPTSNQSSFQLSDDDSILAACYGNKNGVVVWDTQTYQKRTEWLTAVTPWHPNFLAENRQLLVEQGQTATIWDIETGKQLRSVPTDLQFAFFARNMGEKNLFCAYDKDFTGFFFTFDLETGETEKCWKVPQNRWILDLSADKTTLLSPGGNCIDLFDLASGDTALKLDAHVGEVSSAQFAPGYKSTYQPTPCADGKSRVVPVGMKPYNITMKPYNITTIKITISPEGAGAALPPNTDIISGHYGGYVYRINLQTGEIRWQSRPLLNLAKIRISSDGKLISVSGHNDGRVAVLDAQTGETLKTFTIAAPHCASFSPDSKTIAVTGNFKGGLISIDSGEGTDLGFFGLKSWVNAWSPDGKSVAALFQEKVVAYDTATGETKELFDIKSRELEGIAYSPDGKWLAVGCRGKNVFLYNLQTGDLKELEGCSGGVQYLTISPDGRQLAVCDWGRSILRWDLETGEPLPTLDYGSRAFTVEYSPDGKYMIASGERTPLRVWDTATGTEILSVSGLPFIYSALFVPAED